MLITPPIVGYSPIAQNNYSSFPFDIQIVHSYSVYVIYVISYTLDTIDQFPHVCMLSSVSDDSTCTGKQWKR